MAGLSPEEPLPPHTVLPRRFLTLGFGTHRACWQTFSLLGEDGRCPRPVPRTSLSEKFPERSGDITVLTPGTRVRLDLPNGSQRPRRELRAPEPRGGAGKQCLCSELLGSWVWIKLQHMSDFSKSRLKLRRSVWRWITKPALMRRFSPS